MLLAASPQLEGVSGRYFEDCGEARTVPADDAAGDGVREYAIDPHAARRLWEESLAMLEAPVTVSVAGSDAAPREIPRGAAVTPQVWSRRWKNDR